MKYENEVRKCLGPEVFNALLEAVDCGEFGLQQAEDLATGLHSRAKGNFLIKKQSPNYSFDKHSLRKIFSDWYQHDWPDDQDQSGVTLKKLLNVLERNEENKVLIKRLKLIKENSEDQVQYTSLTCHRNILYRRLRLSNL